MTWPPIAFGSSPLDTDPEGKEEELSVHDIAQLWVKWMPDGAHRKMAEFVLAREQEDKARETGA